MTILALAATILIPLSVLAAAFLKQPDDYPLENVSGDEL